MDIVSQDTLVTVTFDVALQSQATSDAASYEFSSPGGGVPIAVLGVEPRRSSPASDQVIGVQLYVNKPTNGREYRLETRGLNAAYGGAYKRAETFIASSEPPSVASAEQLDEGQIVVTFSEPMRVDDSLLSPAEYSITGPTDVLVKSARTVSRNQVMLTTVGLGEGEYALVVNASGTLHDFAGNSISPVSNQAMFSGGPSLASRSIFTDKGPITKPAVTLQSAAAGPAAATINSPTQLTLPTANITPSHVGLHIALSDSLNEGVYRITSRVSSTVVKLAASFSQPDPLNGRIPWRLIDYRDGQIADDPADVVVRINGDPVTAEAVIGLLGQVVLPVVPAPADKVKIDYAWINNPVVDFRRLNSHEFRLNNWNRDNNRPTDASGHKYRYNNTLVSPDAFVEWDLRAEMAQPQQRDLKYRAYERAYSVALNDPNLLLLNSPNHRIAFPPMTRLLTSTFVNYEGTSLPETAAKDPWLRSGAGSATVSGADLVVVDNHDGGEPIFWTRPLDLTFDHIFAHAWRMRIDATPVLHGVFTGVAAGYSDGETACVVGFLDDGGLRKVGILRRGFGNDPSTDAAWTGGIEPSEQATGDPVALDWSTLRSYRIFRDRSGVISVYVDGSVVPLLRATADELPFLQELNVPFQELQGPFFGSISREAESTSTWSFVRYTAIPINPLESEPSIFVSYEGTTPPESAPQPWTPVGFHGAETILGSGLLLDSTSATDLPSSAAGLISGDFKGYTRIEPLLKESFNTVLDVRLALRTYTQGIAPNAVMAAIDDGDRLIQLSFFSDQASPKLSYGGRTLPPDFASYQWQQSGTQSGTMVGQYLKISDASEADDCVYTADDDFPVGNSNRVLGYDQDYVVEFRVHVLSYTPDPSNGFCGVMSSVFDGERAVGVQLVEVLEGSTKQRYVELHTSGAALKRFAFNWFDGAFHTFRFTRATAADGGLVSAFADGNFLGSSAYSDQGDPDVHFLPPAAPSLVGKASFGSATPVATQAKSEVLWAYSNCWRVTTGRRFVGLWKGYDPDSLTGYHLPVSATGRSAAVHGNALTDSLVDFVALGVASGDQLIVDYGPNKGVYTVEAVAPQDDVTKLTMTAPFSSQPSLVDYRCVREVDWTSEHQYRIVKDPSGGVSVFFDSDDVALMRVDYSSTSLPPSSVGIPQAISAGLPSITWGAFDPNNLSQTFWDFVRFGAIRSLSANGIAPHHQVLNQRNIMASFEHHRSNISHSHTNFWSESEGIPPQTEPDLLRNPDLVAFTLLNDRTPLVPSTQTYEIRAPKTLLVSVAGLNSPQEVLNHRGFLVNSSEQRIEVQVPDDVLYNSLQVIERDAGDVDLIAPFDDESQPYSLGSLFFTKEVCLSYEGSVLPENDTSASSPWAKVSEDPAHQLASVASGALTYGTDSIGTRTLYRNATLLPDATSLHTEVKFRLKLLQDASGGLGDSQVRVGFSSPDVTVGLAFVTTPIGERCVLVVDLNNGQTVGGIPFDFYDGAYHTYVLSRDPGSASIQIRIEP